MSRSVAIFNLSMWFCSQHARAKFDIDIGRLHAVHAKQNPGRTVEEMEAWVSVVALVCIQRRQENLKICKTLKHANLWLFASLDQSDFPEDQPLSVVELSSWKPTELCQTMPSTGDELMLQQFCFRAPRSPVTFTCHTRVRAFGKITTPMTS